MNLTLAVGGKTIFVEDEQGDLCIPAGEVQSDELYEATIYANTSTMLNRDKHVIFFTGASDVHISIKFVSALLQASRGASL